MRKKDDSHPLRMLALITQLGIAMMTAIFMSAWLGLRVRQVFHSDFIFPVFLLIGALAGFRSCYHIIRRFVSLGKKEELEDGEVEKMDREDK